MEAHSIPIPNGTPPGAAEADRQTEILRRLGLECLPAHTPAWVPLTSMMVIDEEQVRVPRGLVESIKLFGVLQAPCVVRCSSATDAEAHPLYEVIAGRRRTLAARLAGLSDLKVEVYAQSTPQLSAMLALIENAQRSRAWIKEVMDLRLLISQKVGLNEEELVACGFARQSLGERLKMARLPAVLLDQIASGRVPLAVARKLVRLTTSQLARVSEAARHDLLTADLVTQALQAQMSASVSSLPVFPSWDVPSGSPMPASPLTLDAQRPHRSRDELLTALRVFCQSAEEQQDEDLQELAQALLQRLEEAARETASPTRDSESSGNEVCSSPG